MRLLDEDCLYNIFLHAIEAPVLSTGYSIDLDIIPPANFSAVARSWRTVTSTNPILWSRIHLEHADPDGGKSLHHFFLRFVQVWLKNSKSALLSINIRVRGTGYDSVCDDILDLLIPEHRRWREVNVDMLGIAPWRSFTLPCSPSLVSIVIRVSVGSDNPMQRMVVDLTPSATSSYENVASLSRLVVPDCMKWGLPDRYDSLSLPNLTELRFGAPLNCDEDVDIVLALLSVCRNLQILYIDGEMSISSFAATAPLQSGSAPTTVVLPCLVDLELTSPENHIFHLIERIDCPSLLQFSYRSPRNFQPQHLQSLTSFFSRNTSDSYLSP